jgi:hypothetical protein
MPDKDYYYDGSSNGQWMKCVPYFRGRKGKLIKPVSHTLVFPKSTDWVNVGTEVVCRWWWLGQKDEPSIFAVEYYTDEGVKKLDGVLPEDVEWERPERNFLNSWLKGLPHS